MVASWLRGQFAWRPLYGGQLSCDHFVAISSPCLSIWQGQCPSGLTLKEVTYVWPPRRFDTYVKR